MVTIGAISIATLAPLNDDVTADRQDCHQKEVAPLVTMKMMVSMVIHWLPVTNMTKMAPMVKMVRVRV